MDFVKASTSATGGLGSDNGPILYTEPNRTSAIDDIRSVVIYVFIVTTFLSFFLILPGIRNEKFPTFLCITTSLVVTSIILVSLFGTTWHVAEAPISAAYKAFSRDRIQGHLSVKIGLQSVNITLRAHKYYILHADHGPMIIIDSPSEDSAPSESSPAASLNSLPGSKRHSKGLTEDLLVERHINGSPVDVDLEVDEVFSIADSSSDLDEASLRRTRSSGNTSRSANHSRSSRAPTRSSGAVTVLSQSDTINTNTNTKKTIITAEQRYTIKRINVDINYNERFYWIEPNQMIQEHHRALERGLPYPILTVVEYLSQDEAGFSWSRQYRLAGYYSYIILWLSLCVCVLMFVLHCAAPKYGIYAMQTLGCLLLSTNLAYAALVPRGEQKLVIPFEGESLTFEFGWNFWLVLIGGGLSLVVGTLIVIIDWIFPNFIFTTILDVDFDLHNKYYKHHQAQRHTIARSLDDSTAAIERSVKSSFFDNSTYSTKISSRASNAPTSPLSTDSHSTTIEEHDFQARTTRNKRQTVAIRLANSTDNNEDANDAERALHQLFVVDPSLGRVKSANLLSIKQLQTEGENIHNTRRKQDSSVVEILEDGTSDTYLHQRHKQLPKSRSNQHHYHTSQHHKNFNLKSTAERAPQQGTELLDHHQVRL